MVWPLVIDASANAVHMDWNPDLGIAGLPGQHNNKVM